MTFDEAFHRLLGHEGAYSNNPADPGGETMWGVTVAVARAWGYMGPMRSLAEDTAKQIYRVNYWNKVRADELPALLRFDVFDGAVNSGVSQSIKWLQRAVGAVDDGVIGPATIKAAQSADAMAVARFNGARLQFMTDTRNWTDFGKGWARRIAGNLAALRGPR